MTTRFGSGTVLLLCFGVLCATLLSYFTVHAACVDIAGVWNYSESGTVTCSAEGESETQGISGSGSLTIYQNGCNVTYYVPQMTNISRSGTIAGNSIQVTGPLVVPLVDGVTITQNTCVATGTISSDERNINMSSNGSARGSYEGVTIVCTATSQVTLTRYDVLRLMTVTKSGSGSGIITSSLSGINCGSTCTVSYASGTSVTLTAVPSTGSTFTSWSGCDSVSGSTCTLTMNTARQVTAYFSSTSPSAYFNTVQKLYIGYYQRPADPEGLLFWARGLQSVDVNGDGSFDGENFMWVLEQFAFSAESRKIYGGDINSTNIANVIDSIYMGLFNRHAESDGLAFWVNSFNTGASTPASILWEVMKGAQGTDRDTLNNKVTASNRLTHVLDPELDGVSNRAYPSWANSWLSDVTYDPATIPTEDAIRGLF